jgi:hypothetical protein
MQQQIENLKDTVKYLQNSFTTIKQTQVNTNTILRAVQALDAEFTDLSGQNHALINQLSNIKSQIMTVLQSQSLIPEEVKNKVNALTAELSDIRNGKYPDNLTVQLKSLNDSVSAIKNTYVTPEQFTFLQESIKKIQSSPDIGGPSGSTNVILNQLANIQAAIQELKSSRAPGITTQIDENGAIIQSNTFEEEYYDDEDYMDGGGEEEYDPLSISVFYNIVKTDPTNGIVSNDIENICNTRKNDALTIYNQIIRPESKSDELDNDVLWYIGTIYEITGDTSPFTIQNKLTCDDISKLINYLEYIITNNLSFYINNLTTIDSYKYSLDSLNSENCASDSAEEPAPAVKRVARPARTPRIVE